MARTVEPNGSAVKEARLAKGWSTTDLAEKAECSKRTVENVEAGCRVYPFTLRQVADALGSPVEKLVKGALPAKVDEPKPVFSVSVTVDVKLYDFDQTIDLTNFMSTIQALAKTTREIEVSSVKDANSISITFKVTAEEFEQLVDAIRIYQRETMKRLRREGGIPQAGVLDPVLAATRLVVSDDEAAPDDLKGTEHPLGYR